MTQPPYREPHQQPGYVPYDTGGTPPGFQAPGQTPWTSGQPLAAANVASKKRFMLVMAFFGVLLVVSVVGFAMTTGKDIKDAAVDAVGRDPLGRPTFPELPSLPGLPTGIGEPNDPPLQGPVPAPVVYRGTGDKVLKIRRPEPGAALVYLRASGGDQMLIVTGEDAQGRGTGFVVAALGRYEGVRMLDVSRLSRTTRLDIKASGSWVVEIRSARSARSFGRTMSGTGDTVFQYTGPAGTAAIRGGAESRPFLVMTHSNGFPSLVATAVGSFNGSKPFPQGPVLVEVQATGRWSITVR